MDEDFVGKDSIAGESSRSASAVAMTVCSLLRIEQGVMLLALEKAVEVGKYVLEIWMARNIRYQQDIFGQKCIPGEKRLARTLLLLAHFNEESSGEVSIPNLHHQTLADMVGTTRSRVSFFMTRFRKSGLINYTRPGEPLLINRSLLAFCSQ